MKSLQTVLALLLQCGSLASAAAVKPRQNNALRPYTFVPLPLGTVQAGGWLRDQMQLMADGLAGNEMNFYDIVRDSRWSGGSTDYSDLNEGLPYWFNGMVPLAYGLNNQNLISQVNNAANYVLDHQNSEGWLGPETSYDSNSIWGRIPFLLGLTQLAEANPDYTDRVVTALNRFTALMDRLLDDGKSGEEVWGRARYADAQLVLQWLYQNHPGDNPAGYVGTMRKLEAWGLDWAGHYTEDQYPFEDLNTFPENQLPFFGFLHAVNVAQGLKTMGVDYRFLGDENLAETQRRAVNWTFQYHGSPSGSVLGDERIAGLGPHHGSETCTTVEAMYSLTTLYHILGTPLFADRAELAAYNALPAAMSPNHWQHNYMSLPNQPWVSRLPEHDGLFWNTGTDSIVFGVQPNYPCCAVNHPQGWPKLAAATFARAENNRGIAHTVLAPGSVRYTIADGNEVSVTCETAYPFGSVLRYAIQAGAPFTFYVRVPGWQTSAPRMVLNGAEVSGTAPDEHGVAIVQIPQGESTLVYTLSPEVRVEQRANDTVAVHHGALLYAVDLGQTWRHEAPDAAGAPAEGNTLFYNNTEAWNLAVDPATLRYAGPGEGDEVGVQKLAWEYRNPPNAITVEACEIEWEVFHGIPWRVPLKGNRRCVGERRTVTMRPYGSLRSRMVELPTIE